MLVHKRSRELAVAELKVWRIPISDHYPDGIKFSLFLVAQKTGETLIGIDNHQPKGPHLHLGRKEVKYFYRGPDRLVEDFWRRVRKGGFEL